MSINQYNTSPLCWFLHHNLWENPLQADHFRDVVGISPFVQLPVKKNTTFSNFFELDQTNFSKVYWIYWMYSMHWPWDLDIPDLTEDIPSWSASTGGRIYPSSARVSASNYPGPFCPLAWLAFPVTRKYANLYKFHITYINKQYKFHYSHRKSNDHQITTYRNKLVSFDYLEKYFPILRHQQIRLGFILVIESIEIKLSFL